MIAAFMALVMTLLPWQATPNYQHLGPCGKQIADSINVERVVRGREPLRISWALHKTAWAWSATQREDNAISHSGLGYSEIVGTSVDCETLITAWWESSEHRRIALMYRHNEMGPGSVGGTSGRVFGTVLFQ